MTVLSIEAKCITLTLVVKKTIWLRLFLNKLELFQVKDMYVKINVIKENISTQVLKINIKA